MQIKLAHHAVDQGGLFSGELTMQGKPLRWVYDCVSNKRDALRREIKTVACGAGLDILFRSHLDNDHVGGVDELLAQVKVREVVLPCIDEAVEKIKDGTMAWYFYDTGEAKLVRRDPGDIVSQTKNA